VKLTPGLILTLLLGLLIWRGCAYMEGGRAEARAQWEHWADSVVTVERDAFARRADSLAAAADSIQSYADTVQRRAAAIKRSGHILSQRADSINKSLQRAQSAADSVSILVAAVATLREANDSLVNAFDRQMAATAALETVISIQAARIADDSARIASLESVIEARPGAPKLLGIFPAPSPTTSFVVGAAAGLLGSLALGN